jgi:hypothetical protein
MRIWGSVCLLLLAGETAGFARSSVEGYSWHGRVGQTLRVRNLNGPVIVEAAPGAEAEVTAIVTYERSNPNEIRFEQRGDDKGVTICATWPGQASCFDKRGGSDNTENNDLGVEFHVKLPRGAAIRATTVNGALSAQGVDGDTHLSTVNGSINVAGTGPLHAETVNGSIEVRLGSAPDADVVANTVNGRIEILGQKYPGGGAQTTLGRGGRKLRADTVNGSIRIK